jgi:hypothetical protein
MTGDSIPDTDHVSHYCAPKKVSDGRPKPDAFLPRSTESYLSANWLEHEHFKQSNACAIDQVRGILGRKIELKRDGRFAVFNIGDAKRRIARNVRGMTLRVDERPEEDDPTHAGISYIGRSEDARRASKVLRDLSIVHAAVPDATTATVN